MALRTRRPPESFAKAAGSGADAVILDLEAALPQDAVTIALVESAAGLRDAYDVARVDGQMIDRPLLRRAERIWERHCGIERRVEARAKA